jgi:thiol-disulfide isomerase/thioredoxin
MLVCSFLLCETFLDRQTVIHFTLYSRSYCHLCDDMLQALQQFSAQYPFKVDVLDVDADELLLARYDELVPVLVGRKGTGDATEICHYFLDDAKVIAFLEAA